MRRLVLGIMLALLIVTTFCVRLGKETSAKPPEGLLKSQNLCKESGGFDWPMYHNGNSNSGYTTEAILPPLRLAWVTNAYEEELGYGVLSSPVVANGVIYVGSDDSNVYAINATTGSRLWKYRTGDWVRSTPCVVEGIVYVSSQDGYVYALNSSDGTLKWRSQFIAGFQMSSPKIDGDTLFVASVLGPNPDSLVALNIEDGSLRWRIPFWSQATPAVANGVVYIGNNGPAVRTLYALNETDGTAIWQFQHFSGLENVSSLFQTSPVVSDGMVYAVCWTVCWGFPDCIFALNATNGQPIWESEIGAAGLTSPAMARGTIFVGTCDYISPYDDSALFALDVQTGNAKWRYRVKGYSGGFSDPAVSDRTVYVAGPDGYLHILNATDGSFLGKRSIGGVGTCPAIAEGKVIVGSSDGNVYCFESVQVQSETDATITTYPCTLNTMSRSHWITTYVELPDVYDVNDIDVSTLGLNNTFSVLPSVTIEDYDNDSTLDLMIRFNRTEVVEHLLNEGLRYGNICLTLTGKTYYDTSFRGTFHMLVSALAGDADCDGRVTIKDIVQATTCYGVCETDPLWDPNVNFAPSWDRIDVLDIVTGAANYGEIGR